MSEFSTTASSPCCCCCCCTLQRDCIQHSPPPRCCAFPNRVIYSTPHAQRLARSIVHPPHHPISTKVPFPHLQLNRASWVWFAHGDAVPLSCSSAASLVPRHRFPSSAGCDWSCWLWRCRWLELVTVAVHAMSC